MPFFIAKNLYLRLCFFTLIFSCLLAMPVSAQSTELEDCILIIGDSIPAGHAVSEVPGFGFPVLVSEPFSRVLDRFYNEINITHIGIYNLAVGASSLSPTSEIRYQDTMQYA